MFKFNRRGAVLGALAGGALLASATLAIPTAAAQPECTAAGLSSALGTVSSATGSYLSSHPRANEVITNSGALPAGEAENAIRQHFIANPGEWAELQSIAMPLRNLRQQCNVDVAPAEIARLFDAMAS